MADSGALRQRRSKAHKSGDHSLCGSRCNRAEAPAPVLTVLPPLKQDAVPDGLDPVLEMRRLALRLITAHEGDAANTLLARELRATLKELMPKDAGSVDADLTGLFAALQA